MCWHQSRRLGMLTTAAGPAELAPLGQQAEPSCMSDHCAKVSGEARTDAWSKGSTVPRERAKGKWGLCWAARADRGRIGLSWTMFPKLRSPAEPHFRSRLGCPLLQITGSRGASAPGSCKGQPHLGWKFRSCITLYEINFQSTKQVGEEVEKSETVPLSSHGKHGSRS